MTGNQAKSVKIHPNVRTWRNVLVRPTEQTVPRHADKKDSVQKSTHGRPSLPTALITTRIGLKETEIDKQTPSRLSINATYQTMEHAFEFCPFAAWNAHAWNAIPATKEQKKMLTRAEAEAAQSGGIHTCRIVAAFSPSKHSAQDTNVEANRRASNY
jgi:hypothetical protein